MNWEEAVRWYRDQPGNEAEVRNNYFDLPVHGAAERYANSEEFAEVLRLLGPGEGKQLLDLGAGNGIASFALAKHGWRVAALEPDSSEEVGAGAIRSLAANSGLPITVIQQTGEQLPFSDKTFHAIHARQVLHHAEDLEAVVQELRRVLQHGGLLLSTREHVVDNEQQLLAFRNEHPLHRLYRGENAYPLDRYLESFAAAGLLVKETWGPLESILNFFPGTEKERQIALRQVANHSYLRFGRLFGWSDRFRQAQLRRHTRNDSVPGRIFSFLIEKP
jgi:ubiquinone/menaquinone biosynthesis C-methylase UbiE